MKKVFILLMLCFTLCNICLAKEENLIPEMKSGQKVYLYDKSGGKTGYLKQQSNKINVYNKSGQKQGYYKKSSKDKFKYYEY